MHSRHIVVGLLVFCFHLVFAQRFALACDACRAGSPVPGHATPGNPAGGAELMGPMAPTGAPAISTGPSGSGGVNFLGRQVVVANRGGASISVIDVLTNAVQTIPMPAGANTPEPMYFWYNAPNDLLFVGDRANNRVVAFDPRTYSVVNPNIPAGGGIFHMWGSPTSNRLWVVNDTTRRVSVIDMIAQTNIGSFPTPADLGANAIPHDIVVEPDGSAAYVSIFNTDNPLQDVVVKYGNAPGFPELDRGATGKSAHLGFTPDNNVLYALGQNSNRTDVLDRGTLDPAAPAIPMAAAHGVASSEDGDTMYMTSFPGDGIDGLHVVSPLTHTLITSVDTPAGPHNVVTSTDDTRLYITHSGAASTLVSIFDISGPNRLNPVFLTTVDAGINPFGLLAIPEIPEPAGSGLIAGVALAALARRRAHLNR